MPFENRVALPDSKKAAPVNATVAGTVAADETVRVTIVLRRQGAAPAAEAHGAIQEILSQDLFAVERGASQSDADLVVAFAHEFELTVEEISLSKRRVMLVGTAEAMSQAFGAEFSCYKSEMTGHSFRGRTGTLSIPAELDGPVLAVLGLDDRPAAKPHFRMMPSTGATAGFTPHAAAPQATSSFTPPQVAALYNFPTKVTGAGQTIAIIELGGGYRTADLNTYFKALGLKTPSVTAISVDKGKNTPGGAADGEVMLDIEVAGSIAPGAKIAVYFAPNTDQGFVNAITDAAHDKTRKPSVISISWGAPEDSWTVQGRNAMNAALQDAAALGVTVTVASGDNGSTDGATDKKLHVDFPASSPFALACGGTTLKGSGSTISSEVVWNEVAKSAGATGGGVSIEFAKPAYQNAAGVPAQPQTKYVGRGVPDVAGDADPLSGYQIRVNGQNVVVGGTSAVAPLWASLIALVNQSIGKNVGFINPALYAGKEAGFHDITSGNNDDSSLGSYSAKAGWDPCTGLGSPNGAGILKLLSSNASSATTGGAK